MKFSCTQENLKRGLLATSAVANRNLNLPILNNVLVRLEGTGIQMISTNLEVAVRCTIRGKVDEAGEFTLPSKLFLDYVNLLPDDRVDLELDGTVMKVSCKKNSTKIKGIPAVEYPLIPAVDRKAVFHVPGAKFRRALAQVTFAVSNVESRPELTGVLFSVNPSFAPGKLLMAATDSHRLSEKILAFSKEPALSSTDRAMTTIVPGRTLNELSRILALYKDGESAIENVEVSVGESQIAFRFGDVELISRVIDGKYPDYRPIIPERFTTEAIVPRADIAQAVKSASLFSKAGLQDVHFDFSPGEGLTVASSEGQMGKNDSFVDGKVEGQKNGIILNYRYFLDGIGAIETPTLRMRIVDAMDPCVLAPDENDADEKLTYIIMPIRQ